MVLLPPHLPPLTLALPPSLFLVVSLPRSFGEAATDLADAVVVEDVDHAGHLAEDEDPVAGALHAGQEAVQQHELAAVVHQVRTVRVQRAVLQALGREGT